MNKKTVFFASILILVIVISTILALHLAKKTITPHVNESRNPDFFMNKAVYLELNKDGTVHSQMQAAKLIHYVEKDSCFFDSPNMKMFNGPETQPWYISADKGWGVNGIKTVYLTNNVKISQKGSAKNPDMKIVTAAMTIFPQRKYAETNKPVTITQAGSVMHAGGAQADLKTGVVNLVGKVDGQYDGR